MKQAVKNILNKFYFIQIFANDFYDYFYITNKDAKVSQERWLVFRHTNNNHIKLRDLTRVSYCRDSVKYSLSKGELQNFIDALSIYLHHREASQNKAILRCFIREAKLSIRQIAEALQTDTKTVYNMLYKHDLIDIITQNVLSDLINSAGVESYNSLVGKYIYSSYKNRSNSQEDLKDQIAWYKSFKIHQAEVKKKLSELKWTLYMKKKRV